jgi:hypothetical protein
MKHDIKMRRGGEQRLTWAAVLACLAVLVSAAPHQALAMGAFAAGVPDDPASQGVAFGYGVNYSNRQDAEARAMEECRKQPLSPATVARCKVVSDFDHSCVAVAFDPKAGTPGYGWAFATTEAEADNHALGNCRAIAGADRAPYCAVSLSQCDTGAPAK